LDDFDAVAVRVADEEAVGSGNGCGLLGGNAMLAEVLASRGGVGDAQGEVTRADRVRPVFQQQVNVHVAQVEPEHHEVEGAWLVDLIQAEHVAVEAPAAFDVGNDNGTVVDLRDLEAGHKPHTPDDWLIISTDFAGGRRNRSPYTPAPRTMKPTPTSASV